MQNMVCSDSNNAPNCRGLFHLLVKATGLNDHLADLNSAGEVLVHHSLA